MPVSPRSVVLLALALALLGLPVSGLPVAAGAEDPAGTTVREVRVTTGSSDAEQGVSGSLSTGSSDLELTTDGSTRQVVGMRFAALEVPKGATITRAYVQFKTAEVSTGPAALVLRAEAADDAAKYNAAADVISRTTTSTSVPWSPADWTTVGQAGTAQRTPDVSSLVQAVVDRAGWASGKALALQVTGTGRRSAVSFEGGASAAPLLHVEYTTGGGAGTGGTGGTGGSGSTGDTAGDTSPALAAGPGLIDGIEIESHDRVAPVVDAKGNLYRVTEGSLAAGNRPRMMKSADGGRTWEEQDAANRPTTGDLEGGWLLQDGPSLWFAWQKGRTVHLTKYRTSDHPTKPDTYEIQREDVASPESPGPQYASLAKNADGSLWVAHGTTPSGGPRTALVKRSASGSYGTPIVIDTRTATTAPQLIKGSGDMTHLFYKDHTNNRVYWRTLTTSGTLSAPVRVDSGGTHKLETAITNAVAFVDNGVQVLVVAFADPSGILRSVEIRNGVVGPEQVVSATAVTTNPGPTTNLAAVAHLAVAGTTVVAMWSDAANGHVYRDQRRSGGSWGTDVITVDTGSGTSKAAWYVYANTLGQSADRARIGFTYDLGPHVDDDSNIMYDEVSISTSGGGGSGTVEPPPSTPSTSGSADVRISSGADDAEQADSATGPTSLYSSDLELVMDGKLSQVVGLRFARLDVPKGATITRAYVQFRADGQSTGASALTLRAEAADSAARYAANRGELTGRAKTKAAVSWAPPTWGTAGEAAAAQRTPDLSALMQEVVGRSTWTRGNAFAVQIAGTGVRRAMAFEGNAGSAPLLHVEWRTAG